VQEIPWYLEIVQHWSPIYDRHMRFTVSIISTKGCSQHS
jgi:hypothetical protein